MGQKYLCMFSVGLHVELTGELPKSSQDFSGLQTALYMIGESCEGVHCDTTTKYSNGTPPPKKKKKKSPIFLFCAPVV